MTEAPRPFERLAGALLLAAVALVPLHADPETVRVFEGEKVLLLRSLGSLALVAALLARPLQTLRLAGLAGVGLAVYLAGSTIAAFTSAAPALALPGSYERQQGLMTDLALAGVFLAAALVARREGSISRPGALQDVLLAGGAISAALAVAQSIWSAAPFPIVVDETSRAGGFAGGPTFLGSHLAALVPLAVATCRSAPRLIVLIAISGGLFASGSRAAALAAVVGAVAAAALSAPKRRVRWFAGIAAALAVSGATLLPAVRESLPEDALPNRARPNVARADIDLRLSLWSEASGALAADPRRLAFGHGPDSIGAEFAPSMTPKLQRRLGGATRVDRFHCDWLDLLFTRGALAVLGALLFSLGALRAGLFARRNASGAGDPSGPAGWIGVLAALAVDQTFSVSGATSRLLLCVAAGALVGLASAARDPGNVRDVSEAPESSDARRRSIVAGLLVVTVAYATRDLAWIALALPAALLVFPAQGMRAPLSPALLAGVAFVATTAIVDVSLGGRSAVHSPSLAAAHGILYRVAFLGISAAAIAALAAPVGAGRAGRAAPAERRRSRLALTIALVLAWAWTAKDDVLRGVADVDSAAAAIAQRAGGRARDAVDLLSSAIRLAPEVAEYRTQHAIATIDLAAGPGASSDPTRIVESVGTDVGAAVARHARDGWVLARGANAILRLIPFAEPFRPGLEQRAIDLAKSAVERAPTACPVLETAAEALLRAGRNDEAAALLANAFAIDARRGRTLLLLGRTAVARERREEAAQWHALAVTTDVDPAESFAALALAAMSEGDLARAATMLERLAARVAANPRFDVAFARKLLLFVPFHHRRDAFARAREEWRGDPAALDAIDRALDF